MNAAAAPESWAQWTSRVAAELAGLTEGEWLTLTAAQGVGGGVTRAPDDTMPYAAGSAERERRWSLRRRRTAGQGGGSSAMPDVFVQARLLEGVLALECISDTEFEGLSDLTSEQEQALVALGWEQERHGPAFHRTFTMHPKAKDAGAGAGAAQGASATEATGTGASEDQARSAIGGTDATSPSPDYSEVAARLLRDSLERVLGARSPDDIVLRRSVRDT